MSNQVRWSAAAPMLVAVGLALAIPQPGNAQGPGTQGGEWHFLGGDAWHTRYQPEGDITRQNFGQLERAWEWDASTFGSGAYVSRSTPTYVNGTLYTVAGERRHVVAIDAATGVTKWSYREPDTWRYEYSMRAGYGKGVAYTEIDGRGVVYISTPALFLHALDAETGAHLPNWGRPVPLDGFPQTGVVDVLYDIIEDWGPWVDHARAGNTYDPDQGLPLTLGYVTSSSPPIVVGNTVIVGNSAEQGYNQTRRENVPGDIQAYDTRTGRRKWEFHVIPRPGEVGHETWENDAWRWTGDVSSWAPMSADIERGIVYIPTNGATMDFYGGFRPGDNLFSTSLIALNAETGERVWHYQMVHHDIWNYDTPTAPILMDVTVDGRRIPGIFQATKQGFVYALNRVTGEPIWPIEERTVPQSRVPGEQLAATQPFPTKPAPFELQGRQPEQLINYTPQIRQLALEYAQRNDLFVPLFNPPTHVDDPTNPGPARICPGDSGGINITNPAAADPVLGIMFIPSSPGCSTALLADAALRDHDQQTGSTLVAYARNNQAGAAAAGGGRAGGAGGRGAGAAAPTGPTPENPFAGLPMSANEFVFDTYRSKVTAIDLNTGETLWVIPSGDAPQAEQDAIRNHPLFQGVDFNPNRGRGGRSNLVVTRDVLVMSGQTQEGVSVLFAVDKRTGEKLASVPLTFGGQPTTSQYGMSSWVHEGRQHIMVQTGSGLVAYALPN